MAETGKLNPGVPAWIEQAARHLDARRWGEAESLYRHLAAELPKNSRVIHNLGVSLQRQGKLNDALPVFQAALAIEPHAAEFLNNLGITFYQLNRGEESVAAFRAALQAEPNFPGACYNLGVALNALKRPEEAVAAYRQALALRPNFPDAWNNLGIMLHDLNRKSEAIEAYNRALALKPDFHEAWNNLGNAYRDTARIEQGVAAYRRSLELRPDYALAWSNLGMVYRDTGQPIQAAEAFRLAVKYQPGLVGAWNNLGVALKDTGQLEEALACYKQASVLQPDYALAGANYLCTMQYHGAYDAAAIYQASRQWNDRFARPLRGGCPPHGNDRSPDRRLRVGYVSQDFCGHCASLFLMPLFSHHDHANVEVFCYSGVGVPDAVTGRLQRCADGWRDILGLNDAQAVDLIRQDKIDILVDLSVHTSGSRLLVFARKPAPIQVTWLGYPGTTGLDAIDYRLTDARLDPPGWGQATVLPEHNVCSAWIGDQEPHYSERSVYLPDCFWCYDPRGMEETPDAPMPEPGPLPALTEGRVTFGCLNKFCKATDRTLDLWARVLSAVPNSQMVLYAPPGPHRERVVARLGVGGNRVQFVSYQARKPYLATLRRIDLCLDTVPCNGGTTTLDALWMGVPVVTRVGETVVGRAGWSLLHHLDLLDLVTRSDGQFVEKAVEWTGDLTRLSALRAALRRRLEQSALMDAARFAQQMEGAYRRMWHRWVASPATRS